MKLNPNHSFSHNLWHFKSLNERCDPILDIYSSKKFLKFKKKPLNLDKVWLSKSCSKNLRH